MDVALAPSDEEDVVLEEPAEKAASAPLLRDPGEPTQEEVDQHNLTHVAFRSCVRGRARNSPHRQAQRVADSPPTLSFDYGFLGTDDATNDDAQVDAGFSPILVMHDDISGCVLAHAMPHKGVDHPEVNLAVRAVCRDIYSLGYKRTIIKDDQEPALIAFLQMVRRALMGEVCLRELSRRRRPEARSETM